MVIHNTRFSDQAGRISHPNRCHTIDHHHLNIKGPRLRLIILQPTIHNTGTSTIGIDLYKEDAGRNRLINRDRAEVLEDYRKMFQFKLTG